MTSKSPLKFFGASNAFFFGGAGRHGKFSAASASVGETCPSRGIFAENAPEEAAEQKQFNKEFAVKSGRLCNSKTPTYNNWGDFTGYKAVKIPCK